MSLQDKLEQKVKEINGGNGEPVKGYEEEQLVPATHGQGQPVSVVPEFAVSVDQARERIQMLQLFVKQYLVHGEDYGLIPGCQRPSLFKPGAEKLCEIYGLSKHVEVTGRLEDWEKPFLHYEVKVTLVNKRSGHSEAEGVGNANSREKKFSRQDTYSIANTLLKIAKKRALIDAVLSATRSSGLFTQDIEDLVVNAAEQSQHAFQVESKAPIDEGQLERIYALAKKLKFNKETGRQILVDHYQTEDIRALTREQGDNLLQKLQDMCKKS